MGLFNSVIGALRVQMGMDSVEFEKGADSAARRMNALEKQFTKMGDKLTSVGKTMSLAITAPIAAFGVSAFKAASDAAELQSAFDQTFGAMSATMNRWAEVTGDAMGRSTQEMQQAANTFGIFFNKAVDPQRAAEMSQIFAELAQDLGSFFNVDTETAIAKLRSGLSGEAEPLRDFGVFLSETAVKAKAAALGLGGVGEELTEQEKIIARYQLYPGGTTNAQGDVARTADGTANQMRKATAAFEELQVTIGAKLLPVVTPLIEKLAALIDRFSKLPDGLQSTIIGVSAFAAALGPVLLAVGGLTKLLSPMAAGLATIWKVSLDAAKASGSVTPALTGMRAAVISLTASLGPYLLAIGAISGSDLYLDEQGGERRSAIGQAAKRNGRAAQVQRRA